MIDQVPAFKGGRFVALTWRPTAGSHRLERVRRKLSNWHIVEGSGWLLASEIATFAAESETHAVAITVPCLLDRDSQKLRNAASILQLLDASGFQAVSGLAAPFRLAWADRRPGVVSLAADPVGLGHLFWAEQGGIALCGSSATLLSELLEAPPALEGLAAFAQFGAFPFDATPYDGVYKVLAGSYVRLEDGRARRIEFNASQSLLPLEEAFEQAVQSMLLAAPDAALELSGGLDSRLILAAIPREHRQGRLAVTIDDGRQGSTEWAVAHRIAAMEKLEHRRVSLADARLDWGGAGIQAALNHVLDGYDCMANPVDKLPLTTVGQDEVGTARFGGQNGEIIRGFYYPLQPLEEPASAALVDRLIDWRLVSNDRVAPSMFSTIGAEALTAARKLAADHLRQFQGSWGQVLDQIYLHFRMQSWAGNAASNRFVGRAILWPFFDSRFLAAANAAPSRAKAGSSVAYKLLARLDPSLASVPLDNGLIPAALAKGRAGARLSHARFLARKAARKIGQKLRPAAGRVIGADLIIDAWHNAGEYRFLDAHKLASLGLFEEQVLDGLMNGALKPDRPTLGFLTLCSRIAAAK